MLPSNHSQDDRDNSGLSISLRLSGTLIAVTLGAGLSFVSGYTFAVANSSNNQAQTQNQSVSCPVANPVHQQPSTVGKHS
jgi:hypothetical protein